jgi:AraC family transcriptional regulator
MDTHKKYEKPPTAPTVSVISQTSFKSRRGLPPRALRRVTAFIDANFARTITLQMLAGIADLSTCHFVRVFKESTGQSPHKYLIHCRVRHARELLGNPELSIAEIALASGFADQSHLTRWFAELTGVTPGNYRWSLR